MPYPVPYSSIRNTPPVVGNISWSSTLTLSLAVPKSGVTLRTYTCSYSVFIQKVYVEVKSWYRTHRHTSFMAFDATLQYQHKPPWDVVGWLLVEGKGEYQSEKAVDIHLSTSVFSGMEHLLSKSLSPSTTSAVRWYQVAKHQCQYLCLPSWNYSKLVSSPPK